MRIQVIDDSGLIEPLLTTLNGDINVFADDVQALNAAEHWQPALILLNHALRGQQTPEYINLLLSVNPGCRIVVVGDELTEDAVLDCLISGAKGYQNSRQLRDYLDKMVRVVAAGEAWVSRKMVARLLDTLRQTRFFDTLVVA